MRPSLEFGSFRFLSRRGWQILPGDLDLSFGHLWSEENDVLEEAIVSDAEIFTGERSLERGDFNQVVTRQRAQADLQRMLRCATPDIAADRNKRASNAEFLQRVAEIGDFLDARALYVGTLPP